MPRYLIEVTHDSEHAQCVRALHAVQRHGSHLVTHAEWGCLDGVHSGWVIGECESRAHALMMVPPEMRDTARVVKLDRFSREQIEDWVAELEG